MTTAPFSKTPRSCALLPSWRHDGQDRPDKQTTKFTTPPPLLQTADCRPQTADCRLLTADCRLQTADCRPQTADCRSQIAGCKLNDTKNLPNKGDVIKNITSCESEKVAWEQGWYFCAKLHWPHSQNAVGYSSPTLYHLTRHITNCIDSSFFFDYRELIMTSSNAH